MKQLEALGMVQYFLYEREDLQLGGNTAFLGPNGTGKTALLDAFQIVLLAADSNKTHFNASGEGKKRARTLREYCLGVYGQSDAERCRTSANTYIDLVFRDPETGEQLHVDTRNQNFRRRYARLAAEREAQLRENLARAGADTLELATGDDLLDSMMRFMSLRGLRSKHQARITTRSPQHVNHARS